jgi:hypothetical protein
LQPELFQSLQSFAVLRDPVDRTLSAYWMLRRRGGSAVAIHPRAVARFSDITDFQAYLDFLETSLTRIYTTDLVMRPQHWFLTDSTGAILVRDLFVLGHHDDAMNRYLSHFGVKSLPRLNVTDRCPMHVSSMQEDQIRRIYARDFVLIEQALADRSASRAA